MDFTLQYCLRLLQNEYRQLAATYKIALAKYGKKAKITQTTLQNTKSGVNKFLTLKVFIRDHEAYESILLRIYSARVAMNENSVIEQLKKIDGLFREENFN